MTAMRMPHIILLKEYLRISNSTINLYSPTCFWHIEQVLNSFRLDKEGASLAVILPKALVKPVKR